MRTFTFAHRPIRATVLLAFVWFIVRNGRTNGLHYYVAPRMEAWVYFLAAGMFALALHQLYLIIRDAVSGKRAHAIDCNCDAHSHDAWKPRVILMYGALIVPLILAFSFPHAVLGSRMAAQKGLNLSPAGTLFKNVPDVAKMASTADQTYRPDKGPAFSYNDYTKAYAMRASDLYNQPLIEINDDFYIESLTSLDMYQDQFIGKKVQISGYVYRLDEMSDRQFALGRFAMRCCVGDSIPLGILVETDDSKQWENDTYVVALGTIEHSSLDGKNVLSIDAKTIQSMPKPQDPYVYGNPYFGA